MHVNKGRNGMANKPRQSRVVKHQTAKVMKQTAGFVCTQTIYMWRDRFRQHHLSAEAGHPAWAMALPGALSSPSGKDGQRGTTVSLLMTAQANSEHFKKC